MIQKIYNIYSVHVFHRVHIQIETQHCDDARGEGAMNLLQIVAHIVLTFLECFHNILHAPVFLGFSNNFRCVISPILQSSTPVVIQPKLMIGSIHATTSLQVVMMHLCPHVHWPVNWLDKRIGRTFRAPPEPLKQELSLQRLSQEEVVLHGDL